MAKNISQSVMGELHGPVIRVARKVFDYRYIQVLIAEYVGGEINGRATACEFVPVTEGEYTEATMNLELQSAQRLMDDLWECGLRPSEDVGSAGQLAATERHLEDMKRIAFHALKVKP